MIQLSIINFLINTGNGLVVLCIKKLGRVEFTVLYVRRDKLGKYLPRIESGGMKSIYRNKLIEVALLFFPFHSYIHALGS